MKNWSIESIAPADLRDAIRRRIGFTPDDTYGWRNANGEPCVPHDPTADAESAMAELVRQGADAITLKWSPVGWSCAAVRAGVETYHATADSARMAALAVLVQMIGTD